MLFQRRFLRFTILTLGLVTIFFLVLQPIFEGSKNTVVSEQHGGVPGSLKVIAVVFFGRKEYISILDCYLKRNLKVNGGILDEVIFAVKTQNYEDLAYLDEILSTQPQYFKYLSRRLYNAKQDKYNQLKPDWWLDSWGEVDHSHWLGSWEAVSEPDAVYIKMDDDIVFIEDGTLSNLVIRLIGNPQYFAVSANIVNGASLSWVHYKLGLHEPFWPEMLPISQAQATTIDWRPSKLPSYEGPVNGPPDFCFDGSSPAPYQGHRWLPVRMLAIEASNTSTFPVSTLTFDAWGPSVLNWAAAAQVHYSFLHHLQNADTWRYKFNLWDYDYDRLATNFLAVRGRDIIEAFPFPTADDEEYVTQTRPKEVGRRVVVDGTGLVSHFAFDKQRKPHGGRALYWTDLLSRYRAYANEMVCGG